MFGLHESVVPMSPRTEAMRAITEQGVQQGLDDLHDSSLDHAIPDVLQPQGAIMDPIGLQYLDFAITARPILAGLDPKAEISAERPDLVLFEVTIRPSVGARGFPTLAGQVIPSAPQVARV